MDETLKRSIVEWLNGRAEAGQKNIETIINTAGYNWGGENFPSYKRTYTNLAASPQLEYWNNGMVE